MSLKDNFNQAIKEILRNEGTLGDDPKGGKNDKDRIMKNAVPADIKDTGESLAPDDSLFEKAPEGYGTSYSENVTGGSSQGDPFADEVSGQADPLSDNYERFEYSPQPEPQRNTSQSRPDPYQQRASQYGGSYTPQTRNPAGNTYRGGGRPPENPYYETEETTIISRNTRISGDISSFANVNIEGSVQGDVKLTKNISVSGKVVGNIECNNAVMSGAQMQGSISSKGQVQIDHDSVLLGNIDTQYLDLNGRIKGNVDVGGKAEFKNDAVIVGDITASTISVIDGAVIKGYVNTTFMQESTSNIFPEAITVGEN